jgi:putative ABC transport system permease protein
MLGLIRANVLRRRARTVLTAGGIAVGVAAIVALLALSAGLNNAAAGLVHLGRADLGLFQRDAGDPTASVVPLSLIPRLKAEPNIVDATPLQLVIGAVKSQQSAIVFGLDPNGFVAHQLIYTRGGRPPGRGQVVIGDILAQELHRGVGSTIRLYRHKFTVSGVYHSGIAYEDQGAITTLADGQTLAGRTRDETTTIAVRISSQTTPPKAEKELMKAFPGLTAIGDANEAVRLGANTVLISKAVLLIVVLALIIGTLAVANTMLAAVLERRRELALLTTIGWSGEQLAGLVLGEAIAVSVIGTGFGLALGSLASGALPPALGLGNFINPDMTAWGLGRGCLIGVATGVIGAMYPIWRATRISSAVALAPA